MKNLNYINDVLKSYSHTSDSHFMQEIPYAYEVFKLGYLDWHGQQYGCHFFSINDAGIAHLKELEEHA